MRYSRKNINPCVYKIICLINKKFYIGSAIDAKRRFITHRYLLDKNKHPNQYLQNSWNKYGENNFKFEIVEYCKSEFSLIEDEQRWIEKSNCVIPNGFNIVKNAGSQLGFKHTELSKQKMSLAQKGKHKSKNHVFKVSRSL